MGTKITNLPCYIFGSGLSIFHNTTCLKYYKIMRNFPICFGIELPFNGRKGDTIEMINGIFSLLFIYKDKIDQFIFDSNKSESISQLSFEDLRDLDFSFTLVPNKAQAVGLEPKNNDGRNRCYWCGEPTKIIRGFTSVYSICESCEK